MNEATRERASHLFRALSNPVRLRIVELLCTAGTAGMTVNDISAALSLGQSATSQNLAILFQTGVLVVEPQGASRRYRVRGRRIARILGVIEEFCHLHSLYGFPEQEGEGNGAAIDPAD